MRRGELMRNIKKKWKREERLMSSIKEQKREKNFDSDGWMINISRKEQSKEELMKYSD